MLLSQPVAPLVGPTSTESDAKPTATQWSDSEWEQLGWVDKSSKPSKKARPSSTSRNSRPTFQSRASNVTLDSTRPSSSSKSLTVTQQAQAHRLTMLGLAPLGPAGSCGVIDHINVIGDRSIVHEYPDEPEPDAMAVARSSATSSETGFNVISHARPQRHGPNLKLDKKSDDLNTVQTSKR